MTFTYEFYNQFIKDLETELNTPTHIAEIYFSKDKQYCGYILIYVKTKTRPMQHAITMHVNEKGQTLIQSKRAAYGYLCPHLQQWGEYVRNRFYAAERIKNFWKESKEELVAAAWHPDRVAKWLEAGIDAEAM